MHKQPSNKQQGKPFQLFWGPAVVISLELLDLAREMPEERGSKATEWTI